jgi:hypothetical protein
MELKHKGANLPPPCVSPKFMTTLVPELSRSQVTYNSKVTAKCSVPRALQWHIGVSYIWRLEKIYRPGKESHRFFKIWSTLPWPQKPTNWYFTEPASSSPLCCFGFILIINLSPYLRLYLRSDYSLQVLEYNIFFSISPSLIGRNVLLM